ncbi:MAG: flagellar basal-body rod modification protein FlgD [Bacillota bacterium]|nr:flagellar hook capping protein [Bacillota bacterium]MDI6637801.1 flagellar hook capping FlgD N-terminal domain-containing protein [Bacillota bacterium]MDK2931427.1 flagellar basal-body rod modification protein FlgD [Bacillota bacterium]
MNVTATSSARVYDPRKETPSQESSRTELGKDAFLKLLLTELRYQDAFKPVDDKEMIAQMAQFSTLEHMQNLSLAMEGLAKMQHAAQAAALIGKKVTATVGDEDITGIVSGVKFKDGVAYLVVEGKEVLVTDVTEIS